MQLTQKVMDFLILVRQNNNVITKNEQKIYDDVRFYIMTNYITRIGLIHCNGLNAHQQKIWKLTPKGERIAELLEKIDDIYYEKGGKENGKKKGKGNSAR
jgi:hypothetical protein